MAQSVLSQLVKTDKETRENLSSINTTLHKIYKIQSKTASLEEQRFRREQQNKKREKGDKGLAKIVADRIVGDKKKKKGGVLGMLGDLFGSIAKSGGLIAALGGAAVVLKVLGIAAIGGVIIGYIRSERFRNFVNDYILKPLGGVILEGMTALFKHALKKFTKPIEDADASWSEFLGGRVTTKDGTIRYGDFLKAYNEKEMEYYDKKATKEEYENYKKANAAMIARKRANDALAGERSRIEAKKKQIDEENNAHEKKLLMAELEAMETRENHLEYALKRRDEEAREILESINIDKKHFLKKQSGGPIKVPGTGSGDKVPMLLPEGSFVLNRNAAGYQMGGIPTLLEPGEAVYGPGQWGMKEFMLNSAIPRFQNGGEVSHFETGSGFTPSPNGLDANNRPVVLSEGAANSFRKMMDAGGVNTRDVASSKRSVAKNNAVGGAPNSNHLTGNAVDIHGASKIWMRANSENYGWKWLDYPGHDGHFDYFGKGNDSSSDEGAAKKVKETEKPKGDLDNSGDPFKNFLSGIGEIAGPLGDVLTGIAGAFTDVFGDELESLSKFLFGGVNLFGPKVDERTKGPNGGWYNYTGEPPEITPGAAGLLKMIRHYESGDNYNKIWGGDVIPGLTEKTIREVVAIQKAHNRKGNESSAIGAYQMMYPDEYGPKVGLTMNDVFSKENQDKMAMAYLEEDGWSAFKAGQLSAEDFANNVAGTWAAFPMPDGRSRYAGVGSNKAGLSREVFMEQIKASKLQQGGVVNMRGTSSNSNLRKESEKQFIDQLASAVSPVIVPMPVGGGSGGGSGSIPVSGTQTEPPSLSAYPSNEVALDLSYRLSMGASFS